MVDAWIGDRDPANNRYGHRTDPHSDPQSFDQYIDINGRRNQAFGHIYRGSDTPSSTAHAGPWRFRLRVIDVCNGNTVIGGQDFVRVAWPRRICGCAVNRTRHPLPKPEGVSHERLSRLRPQDQNLRRVHRVQE